MIHRMKLAAAFALAVGLVGARAEDKNKSDQPLDDATFVKIAGIDGMHEVELGKIGADKAKSADVKKFAATMVADHSKANEELKSAAKAAGVEVPAKLDEKHQKHIDMFKDYKGDNFDGEYMKHMVKDHTQAIALFTRASKELKSKDLKDFAAKTLPVIQGHLDMAKKLQK